MSKSKYRNIEIYESSDPDGQDLGDVVLHDDFDSIISDIEGDVEEIIDLIKEHDVLTALQQLGALSKNLY